MRGAPSLFALLLVTCLGAGEALLVKRFGGTDPVSLELAEEGLDVPSSAAPATSASRFIELSHKARRRALTSHCQEGDCSFAVHQAEGTKTLKQQLKKKAKKLEKKVDKEKKKYLEKHSEEEYAVLKYTSILEALKRENSGEEGGAEGEEEQPPQQQF
ncbi:hypothetical protein, conserved [Eimeria necatrix]|uniref:Uncharacterized protein n=1 Tax=Eimeria necatrix TaxID=51315 RepID=U6MIB9_9EIME|nr:hypothetical protein, conserved [Eimeria necatrix]CDJ63766.1 hypothetical protein, conserved [Eimeria necatrix]